MNRLTSFTFAALSLVPWTLAADSLDDARRSEIAGETLSWQKYFVAAEDSKLSSLTRNRARERGITLLKVARQKGDVDEQVYKDYAEKYNFSRESVGRMDIGDLSIAVKAEEEILKVIPAADFNELAQVLKSYELSLLDKPQIKKNLVGRLAAKLATQNTTVRSRLLHTILFLGGTTVANEIGKDLDLLNKVDHSQTELDNIDVDTRNSLALTLIRTHGKKAPQNVSNQLYEIYPNYKYVINEAYKKDREELKAWVQELWKTKAEHFSKIEYHMGGDQISEFMLNHDLKNPANDLFTELFGDIILPALKNHACDIHDLNNGINLSDFSYVYWSHHIKKIAGGDFDLIRREFKLLPNVLRVKLLRYCQLNLTNEQFRTLMLDCITSFSKEDYETKLKDSNSRRPNRGKEYRHLNTLIQKYFEGIGNQSKSIDVSRELWIRTPGLRNLYSFEFYESVKNLKGFNPKNCIFKINMDQTPQTTAWIETCNKLYQDGQITDDRLELRISDSSISRLYDRSPKHQAQVVKSFTKLINADFFEEKILRNSNNQRHFRSIFTTSKQVDILRPCIPHLLDRFATIRLQDNRDAAQMGSGIIIYHILMNGNDKDLNPDQLKKMFSLQMVGELRRHMLGVNQFVDMTHKKILLLNDDIPLGIQMNVAARMSKDMSDELRQKFFEYSVERMKVLYSESHNLNSDYLLAARNEVQRRFSYSTNVIFNQNQYVQIIGDRDLPLLIRQPAIQKLERDLSEDNRKILVNVLENHKEHKNLVLGLLGWIKNTGDFGFTPAVAGFLDSRDSQMRTKALEALEEIKRIKEQKTKWMEWYDDMKSENKKD